MDKSKVFLEQIEVQLNILLQNFKHIEASIIDFRKSLHEESIYNTSLHEIDGIPTRFANIAKKNGITNVSELLKVSPYEFYSFGRLSIKTIYGVKDVLFQRYRIIWN